MLLLENTRFHAGEEKNDPGFREASWRRWATFSSMTLSPPPTARMPSTEGMARLLPSVGRPRDGSGTAPSGEGARPIRSGRCWRWWAAPRSRPRSRCSENLVRRVEIAGDRRRAWPTPSWPPQGFEIGNSLCEPDQIWKPRASDPAMADAKAAARSCCRRDVVVAQGVQARTRPSHRSGSDVARRRDGLDVGPATHRRLPKALGPRRDPGLERALRRLRNAAFRPRHGGGGASAVAQRTRAGKLLSVAGGGDTVAALAHAGVADDFSYVSTAGGAFLEWLEGRNCRASKALKQSKGGMTDGSSRN